MIREEKMAKRRESNGGNCKYEYKPNPYKKGTREYRIEAEERAAKNKDKRNYWAQLDSMRAKLKNDKNRQVLAAKKLGNEAKNK